MLRLYHRQPHRQPRPPHLGTHQESKLRQAQLLQLRPSLLHWMADWPLGIAVGAVVIALAIIGTVLLCTRKKHQNIRLAELALAHS